MIAFKYNCMSVRLSVSTLDILDTDLMIFLTFSSTMEYILSSFWLNIYELFV